MPGYPLTPIAGVFFVFYSILVRFRVAFLVLGVVSNRRHRRVASNLRYLRNFFASFLLLRLRRRRPVRNVRTDFRFERILITALNARFRGGEGRLMVHHAMVQRFEQARRARIRINRPSSSILIGLRISLFRRSLLLRRIGRIFVPTNRFLLLLINDQVELSSVLTSTFRITTINAGRIFRLPRVRRMFNSVLFFGLLEGVRVLSEGEFTNGNRSSSRRHHCRSRSASSTVRRPSTTRVGS